MDRRSECRRRRRSRPGLNRTRVLAEAACSLRRASFATARATARFSSTIHRAAADSAPDKAKPRHATAQAWLRATHRDRCEFFPVRASEIGRAHVELQSLAYLVCRL